MNRSTMKRWKKPRRQRGPGNPNSLRPLLKRIGKGHIKRRDEKIVRRAERKKRLPDG
jgi:hypothetical protein